MKLSNLLTYVLVLHAHFSNADEVVHFKVVDHEGSNNAVEAQSIGGFKRNILKHHQQTKKDSSINNKTRIVKKKKEGKKGKKGKKGDHSCGELDPSTYVPAVVLNIELKNTCNLATIKAKDVVKAIEKGISTMDKRLKNSSAVIEVNRMDSPNNNDCCYEPIEGGVVSDEAAVEITATIHYSEMDLEMLIIEEDKIIKELNKKLCEEKESCSTVTIEGELSSMLHIIGSANVDYPSIRDDMTLSTPVDSIAVLSSKKHGMACGELNPYSVAPVAVLIIELENTCNAASIDSKDLVKAIEKGFEKEKKSVVIEINSIVTSDNCCYDSTMQDGIQFSRDSSVVSEDTLTTIIVTIHSSYTTDSQLFAIDESKITKELNKKFCEDNEMCSSLKVEEPSSKPSLLFSSSPSQSSMPSLSPSIIPSSIPSHLPSFEPTFEPSKSPSKVPSFTPSTIPSIDPSAVPSSFPTSHPSSLPSSLPSSTPSNIPSSGPTGIPSSLPSIIPSSLPSLKPSLTPSSLPSSLPSSTPSNIPSSGPTGIPSSLPSIIPSSLPSLKPSLTPSNTPSSKPSETKFDIMVLVDGSGSLGMSGFNEEKLKVIEIVNGVPFESGNRIGIILFSTQGSTEIIHGLNDRQNKADILNVVEGMTYPDGWTATREALEVAFYHYRDNEVGNELALFILSDGNPQASSNICTEPEDTIVTSLINNFEDLNPFRYFVGFGNNYSEEKFRCVFGDNMILGNDLDMCIHSPFPCIDDV